MEIVSFRELLSRQAAEEDLRSRASRSIFRSRGWDGTDGEGKMSRSIADPIRSLKSPTPGASLQEIRDRAKLRTRLTRRVVKSRG
jgi:hypothetical protein